MRTQIRIYCADRFDDLLSDNHPFVPGVVNFLFQMSLQHFLKLMLVVSWYLSFLLLLLLILLLLLHMLYITLLVIFIAIITIIIVININSISILTQKGFTNFKTINWWPLYLRDIFLLIRYIFKLVRSKYAKKPFSIQYCNDDKRNNEKPFGVTVKKSLKKRILNQVLIKKQCIRSLKNFEW